jgi:hypothetical protein
MLDATDLLQDTDGDLLIENGDFKIGASDNQHQEDIIGAYPGDWKQFPLVGVGINDYSGSTGMKATVESQIRQQLIADGYKINLLSVNLNTSGKIDITTDVTRIK